MQMSKNQSYSTSLYIVQNELGRIKIGRTNNIKQRLEALKKHGGCEMKLISFMMYFGYREKDLHNKYKHNQWKGEWFEFNEEEFKNFMQEIRALEIMAKERYYEIPKPK